MLAYLPVQIFPNAIMSMFKFVYCLVRSFVQKRQPVSALVIKCVPDRILLVDFDLKWLKWSPLFLLSTRTLSNPLTVQTFCKHHGLMLIIGVGHVRVFFPFPFEVNILLFTLCLTFLACIFAISSHISFCLHSCRYS